MPLTRKQQSKLYTRAVIIQNQAFELKNSIGYYEKEEVTRELKELKQKIENFETALKNK